MFAGFIRRRLSPGKKQYTDQIIDTERENKQNGSYQITSLHWQKSEDTYEVEVYNSAKILGHLSLETIPQADSRIKTELNALGIPFEYTPKLGTSAVKEPNWFQRLGSAKKSKSSVQRAHTA